MTKKGKYFFIGLLLLCVGIFMFFKSVRLSSFGFWRIWGISTGAIIIVLMLLDVIIYVATSHKAAIYAMGILVAALVLSIILGTHLIFAGSLIDLFLMLIPAAIGAGLLIRCHWMD